jgi:hypothetical protein
MQNGVLLGLKQEGNCTIYNIDEPVGPDTEW